MLMKTTLSPEQLYTKTLLQLSRLSEIDDGKLDEAFRTITELTTEALGVERASIWLYDEKQTAIICSNLYEGETKTHSAGLKLEEKDFPAYFKYMREERTLPADNALTDPCTIEFKDVYLNPLNIKSMLDAPVRVRGKMVGVICCEKRHEFKEWTLNDQIFIGNITDIISRSFLAKERLDALAALAEMNANLEKILEERTAELENQRVITANSSKMAILGEMASSIAHEINNPLGIIVGSIQVMKIMEKSGSMTPDIREKKYTEIQATSLRIEKIIRGLRFFARDSSHDDLVSTRVSQIIDDTINLCNQKFVNRKVELRIKAVEDAELFCQPVSISQAILNLLSNSMDAIEHLDEKWIEIETRANSQATIIRITDSGHGIPSEIADKIMMPFYTTKGVGKGTGLGLSIVKGIVEHHKGTFEIDRTNPHTSFVLTFPGYKNER